MQPHLHLAPTSIAQWQALVKEAETAYGKNLTEDLENYLVLLLEYFINKPGVTQNILAIEFLTSQHAKGSQQLVELREIGDKCLLFSGLFPELALHRHVSISYFVELGQQAYYQLSVLDHSALAKLFHDLEMQFVILMDVLQCMRELTGEKWTLSPLLAEELWRHTRSKHALTILQRYTQALPVGHIINPKTH